MASNKLTFDARWVGLGFCFFVTMHLLPAYLMYQLRFISPALTTIYNIWIFAGIAFIGFVIGYLSRNVTVVEAAIAGAVYAFVLMGATNQMWGAPIRMSSAVWVYAIFAIATLSATLGEVIQAMKEKREPATDRG